MTHWNAHDDVGQTALEVGEVLWVVMIIPTRLDLTFMYTTLHCGVDNDNP